MLCLGIVDCHHWAWQNALALTGLQAMDTRRGLLAAADELVCVLLASPTEQIDQVAAVIDDEVRMAGKRLCQQIFIFFRADTVLAECLYSHFRNCRSHVILCGQRITACEINFSAALLEHQTQICGLGLKVNGDSNAHAFERLLFFELLLDLG